MNRGSHRGTRNRLAQPGSVGILTIGDLAETKGRASFLTGISWGQRQQIVRRAMEIQSARRAGVIFRSFPDFVKATDLKTNTVGYGRNSRDALEGVRAGLYQQNGRRGDSDRSLINLLRQATFADYFQRNRVEQGAAVTPTAAQGVPVHSPEPSPRPVEPRLGENNDGT